MTVLPINEPPIDYKSQRATGSKHGLINPALSVWQLSGSGAPANGEGNGWAGVGSIYLDATNGDIYQQKGTLAATVWSLVRQNIAVAPTIAAAGATQGNATAITAARVYVTVTASTEGVKLPAASTGKIVEVINISSAHAFKVYPASGNKIAAAATNAADATLLGSYKATVYEAVNTLLWIARRGA